MPDQPASIGEALVNVMRDVLEVGKDGKFTGGGASYSFRGIEHVLNAVGPAFRTHGVYVLPKLLKIERDQYQTSKGNAMWRYVVEVEYVFTGPDGSTRTAVVPGEASDSADKALSKAMAVALRTVLIQVLAIPVRNDDGEQERHDVQAPPPPPPPPPPGELAREKAQEAP